jgi:hypothetical protein
MQLQQRSAADESCCVPQRCSMQRRCNRTAAAATGIGRVLNCPVILGYWQFFHPCMLLCMQGRDCAGVGEFCTSCKYVLQCDNVTVHGFVIGVCVCALDLSV